MPPRIQPATRALDAGQRALAAQHVPYAIALAGHWKELFPSSDGAYESAASLALCHAARSYDPIRFPAVPFPAFARRRIIGAFLDLYRKEARRPDRAPLGEIDPADRAEPPSAALDAVDELGMLLKGGLTPGQAKAIRFIDVEGRTLAAAARLMDLSPGRVFVLRREAIKKLRAAYLAGEIRLAAIA